MNATQLRFAAAQVLVAVPVKDEAERITDCLLALARQDGPLPGVVLLVNDTTDATMAVVSEIASSMDMPISAIEHRFKPGEGSAGAARRLAMMHADRLAPEPAPLLCTDADGRVAEDWVSRNLHHLRLGADAVFGRTVIDPLDATQIPPGLHEADRQECAYADALDEIAHWIDPDPNDPWPRHVEHSGASIAVARNTYRQTGGIPGVPLGEDRAFAAALRMIDARVRHATDVTVEVSGRIMGRAAGGMADTIRRRLLAPDPFLDDALEPVAARVNRLLRRRALRSSCAAERRPFGIVWAAAETRHPSIPVAVGDLTAEMAHAKRVLTGLRQPAPMDVEACTIG